jgi:DNA helicase TIP49 (TBP-interacting protein)
MQQCQQSCCTHINCISLFFATTMYMSNRNGIVHYGAAFEDISVTLKRLVEQTRNSERTPLMSVLIEGAAFTGKTALAASSAVNSGFPFVRKICADEMVSLHNYHHILQYLPQFSMIKR